MADRTDLPIPRIDADAVRRRMKEFQFVDARSATALRKNPRQIPGAIHLPIKEFDEHVEQLSHRRPIVTYCT